jgi:cell surface protein SprA
MPTEASDRLFAANDEVCLSIAGSDSTLSQQQHSTGKLSRRAKAAQRRTSTSTASTVSYDTSRSTLAAIRALPRDSSARLAQFQYIRKDKPAVDGTYHKHHPLFLSDPLIVKHQAILDSTKWVYRLHEAVNDNDTRLSTEVPLEEYSSLRLKQSVRQNWETITQFYQLQGETKTTLGDVFGKFTKIEVPVPKIPMFSIFGPSRISMTINGAIDIHAAFRNVKSDLVTSSALGQSQSTPDFSQEIQVNVKGEIGDKLKVDADWNTQRTFDYENQLHVKYQGYEDELVQSVEAGNVSLPTNSSFISGGSALFGILAKFQIGPLRLTTVTTQKKGQIKQLSVSGGGQSNAVVLRPSDYSKCHFFIDTSYIKFYENVYQVPALINSDMQNNRIVQIEVWVSTKTEMDPAKFRNVLALMDQVKVDSAIKDSTLRIPGTWTPTPGQVEEGKFVKLDQSAYSYDQYAGIISLQSQPQDDQVVAVCYSINNGGNIITIGQTSQTQKSSLNLVLKLVRPSQLGSTVQPAWSMMLKNRYFLGGTNIDKTNFQFNVEYDLPGQNPATSVTTSNVGVMEILGLDRFSADNSANPDKVFDYIPGVTINEARGEIIFPTVEPFDSSSMVKYFIKHGGDAAKNAQTYAGQYAYGAIYTQDLSVAVNDPRNLYYMRGTVKTAQSASYSIGFNVVEGSVQVIVDGQAATPGVDYTVDYISGQVVIRNQAYLSPGRNVQIKYEANDMFQLASKSLMGARAEVNLSKNTLLGFTIMNYSQQSLSEKVRLGEEPISNTIMGIDGGTTLDARWLTNALNYLPGAKTTALSQISVHGEAAYMMPNPNTRTSPISIDGGKSVAYIDDFEGANQIIPLGNTYSVWKDASAPWFINNLDKYSPQPDSINGPGYIPTSEDLYSQGLIIPDTSKMEYKAQACWFNVYPTDVITSTIWDPSRKTDIQGQDQVTSLDFYFHPERRGEFNYSMNLQKTIGLDNTDPNSHKKSWAGIQHILGTSSTNLVDQNVAFIEFWINVVSDKLDNDSAKLNIDIGYISEDVIPNGTLNTEDGLDNPPLYIPRGILNTNYDWGLDTMNDAMEQKYYAYFWQHYPNHPEYKADPSGDDFSHLPIGNGSPLDTSLAEQYEGVDGTEGNSVSDAGHLPDTEDLNRNGKVDRLNSYFEYEVPLDTTNSRFKFLTIGTGRSHWHQIRIPLAGYDRKIGEPTFTNVEGVRIWVTGAGKPLLFRLVDLNLVGNQWQKRVLTDSSFELSVVNEEDDPLYTMPDPNLRTQDPTQVTQTVLSNEQSLDIIVPNLQNGQYKEVVKYMTTSPINMIHYGALKMFVHGEEGNDPTKNYNKFRYTDTTNYDAEMFLHFGDDTSNYYEYREPVHPGWAGNDVVVKFADLTAIKAAIDSSNLLRKFTVPNGNPGAKYWVRGNPRLDRIQFISIGIENPGKGATVINGELWVDELRLTDVDNTHGWAYKVDANIKLADIGNIGFSFSKRDPFFHGLEEQFGTLNTNRVWSLSTSFAIDKFLPETWNGSIFSLSYSHTESIDQPLYLPGTDILVEKAAQYTNADSVRSRSETMSITDSYSMPTLKFNIPMKTWLVTETINRMSFGYNYTKSYQRNPSAEYANAWGWNASFRYGTQFNPNNYLSLGTLKFFFTPQQLNFGATLSRSQSWSKDRSQETGNDTVRNLSAQRSMDFSWQFFQGGLFDLGIVYNVNITSTLVRFETDQYGNQRSFSEILNDIFFSDRLINFGIDQNYGQGITLNSKVTAPQVLMLDKILTPNLHYSVNYNWTNNIQAGPIGRSAAWSNAPILSLDVNLKPITDAIWSPTLIQTPAPTNVDTSKKGSPPFNLLKQFDRISRILIKNTIFDFEKFSFSFTQSNTAQNSGVIGSTGFANIFARAPFFQSSLDENGPKFLYQLGLISDPNGELVLKTKGTFPFFIGYTVPGIRADSANITDAFSQSNQIAMHTSRPLWTGATLSLDWKVGWTYSENRTSTTDSTGYSLPSSISSTVSGDMDRSYISLPFFKTNLDNVNNKFNAMKQDVNDTRDDATKLSQAFEQGLETLPWLSKILGSLAPRANWSIHWDGLENISFLKSIASHISLDHAYTSDFKQRWQMTPTADPVTGITSMTEATTSETVTYGFSPLIGVNIAFKDFIKGNLSTTFRYGATTSYDLVPSSQNATETSTSDISASVTYSRQGFEIPFFGVSLMNNFDFTLTYGYSHNASLFYDFNNFKKDGLPMNGSGRTTIEPRIRYTLSERVTASVYYSYTRLAPDAGGSTTPGSTTNEGGLDIHVLIQ